MRAGAGLEDEDGVTCMEFLNFKSEPSERKRSIWNVIEAEAVVEPVAAVAESAKASSKVVEEWHRLRGALMLVLRRFPEAKEAVMQMIIELSPGMTAPEWAI